MLKEVVDHATGRPIAAGCLLDQKRHGRWVHWYRSGVRRCLGDYDAGLECGTWTYWYENEHKAAQGFYREGYEHGIWRYWYEDGALRAQGEYRHGDQHGTWTYRDDEGRIERIEQWDEGKLLRRFKVINQAVTAP